MAVRSRDGMPDTGDIAIYTDTSAWTDLRKLRKVNYLPQQDPLRLKLIRPAGVLCSCTKLELHIYLMIPYANTIAAIETAYKFN